MASTAMSERGIELTTAMSRDAVSPGVRLIVMLGEDHEMLGWLEFSAELGHSPEIGVPGAGLVITSAAACDRTCEDYSSDSDPLEMSIIQYLS